MERVCKAWKSYANLHALETANAQMAEALKKEKPGEKAKERTKARYGQQSSHVLANHCQGR